MRVFENGNCWVIEDDLNLSIVEELKAIIKDNLKDLYKNKEGYSTTGKDVDQYWLIDRRRTLNSMMIGLHGDAIKDPEFYKFEEKYRNEILNRIKACDLFDERKKDKIRFEYINAWSVIGKESSYHTIHDHNEGIPDGISTILYLEVPDTNLDDQPENNIFLVTNVGSKNPYYYKKPNYLQINPKVGKLLIFPNWVLHGTYPQTKGTRQTFNIDYRIELEKDKPKPLDYC